MIREVGILNSPLEHPFLFNDEFLRLNQLLDLVVEAFLRIAWVVILFANASDEVTARFKHGVGVVIALLRDMTATKYSDCNDEIIGALQVLI